MATIKSTLSLDDRMSTTFSSITRAMHSTLSAMQSVNNGTNASNKAFQKAQKEVSNAEKALKSYNKQLDNTKNKSNGAASSTGSFLKSLLGFGLIQNLFGMISNRIDSAVSRFDTLNNFPKVMSNLGISAEDSQAAINRLSDGLTGLPTALDDGALAVQRFTSKNGNVKASTEIFLALNNAILAGGASAQLQSSAIEQISQAYAKGKPDMMEWRTLQQAMPAQLNQIAKAMGYVNADKLGADLRSGKVSMNEFMKTITKLNKEGVAGFKNFEEQARGATGGIKTSLANMKTAITKGLTSIMDQVNKSLEEAGMGNIATVINNIGKGLQSMLTTVGSLLGKIIKILTPVFNLIKAIYTFMKNNWSWMKYVILGVVGAFLIYNTVVGITALKTKVLAAAVKLLTDPMAWIAIAIAAVVAALLYLWDTNDTVAYWMLFAWDSLRIGVMAFWLGCQEAFYGIVLAGLYMWQGILGIKMALIGIFYSLKISAMTLQLGFEGVAQGIVNSFIWMYNAVTGLLNKLGAHFETMEYKDFTSKTTQAISDTMGEYTNAIMETYGQMEDTNSKIAEIQQKMKDTAIQGANNIQSKVLEYESTREQRTKDRNKLSAGVGNAVKQAGESFGLDELNNIVDTDSSGSKAVKTTTKDNLLSDDDIQLLLDVATRDYKLNYQQVTPNITLTFGDIRETADVDQVLDAVADKLEEIYDSDLEVARP